MIIKTNRINSMERLQVMPLILQMARESLLQQIKMAGQI
jgi:hypothetical protein